MNLNDLPLLPADIRRQAREQAGQDILRHKSNKPQPEQFRIEQITRFDPKTTRVIRWFMVLLMFAAFFPSAYRVASLANQTFGASGSLLNALAAASFVALAEIGMIGFSLALGGLNLDRAGRLMMRFAALSSVCVALLGNIQFAVSYKPEIALNWFTSWLSLTTHDPFKFIESTLPPLLVLFAATVLKYQILEDTQLRHESNIRYQKALEDWQTVNRNPEDDPNFTQVYAQYLKSAYIERFKRHSRLNVRLFTDKVWNVVVTRELKQDKWFHETPDEPETDWNTYETPADTVVGFLPTAVSPVSASVPTVSCEAVIGQLKQNPELLNLSVRELARTVNCSDSTAYRAITKVKNNGTY
jgi:hypothetical protein